MNIYIFKIVLRILRILDILQMIFSNFKLFTNKKKIFRLRNLTLILVLLCLSLPILVLPKLLEGESLTKLEDER